LFTREYYDAIASRLGEDGLFLQWVQAYNVDGQAVRTIYATLASVFPVVETWELAANDLLLVASRKPIVYDAGALARRIAEEPYRTALRDAPGESASIPTIARWWSSGSRGWRPTTSPSAARTFAKWRARETSTGPTV